MIENLAFLIGATLTQVSTRSPLYSSSGANVYYRARLLCHQDSIAE